MNPRRANLSTPWGRASKRLWRRAETAFMELKPRTRNGLGFGLLVVMTTLLLARPVQQALPENYLEGDIVRRTVVSPTDLVVVDQAETERRQKAARDAQLPVFVYDTNLAENAKRNFRAAWQSLAQQKQDNKKLEWKAEGSSPALIRAIAAHNFSADDLERVLRLMESVAERQIYAEQDTEHFKAEIVLQLRNAASQMRVATPQMSMLPAERVQEKLREQLAQMTHWTNDEQKAVAQTMAALIQPNVRYDAAATALAAANAERRIESVTVTLKRNQVVAREGDTVTPAMLAQFQTLQTHGRNRRTLHHIFGLLFIVAGLFWVTWEFVRRRAAVVTLPLTPHKAMALVGLSVAVQTLLMRSGMLLADSLSAAQLLNATGLDYPQWVLAVPFASGALLVALLVDVQLGFITGLLTALHAAMLAPRGAALPLGLYAFLSCMVAVYGIKRYRERQSVTIAGLLVGVGNALAALALTAYTQQPIVLREFLIATGCGILGGLLTILFTSGGLPINETVFGVLTDVKLLELSNAELPILSQMAMHAAGTNQHSHGVGMLTEEACRAIGANPLLARIGALYHDIGKLGSPLHFIENQNGKNPHDRLKPQQSAKIITNHVTYGLTLAEDIGLPAQIAAFIPQHHGTRVLHYFYRKAQDQAPPGVIINEDDFRYPGPKPQFKESAIMMLADSCEAAARSLDSPTPENLRLIVTKIIKAIQDDGQLDECSLTLSELTRIRESLINSLVAIYHTRVSYPGFNPPASGSLPDAQRDTEEQGMQAIPERKVTPIGLAARHSTAS